MKKTTKMIIMEIVPLFFVINFIFIFLMLLEQLVMLAELLIVHSMPFAIIAKVMIFYMPSFLVLSVPISTLIATFLAFSRFSADSELTAMKACGISPWGLLTPTLIIGVIIAAFGILNNSILLPKGSTLAVNTLNEIVQNLSINDIREREVYDRLEQLVFYADKKIDNANFERVILIYKSEKYVITSKKATIVPNKSSSLMMELLDGRVVIEGDNNTYSNLDFDKLSVNLPLNIEVDMLPTSERLLSLTELKARFETGNIYKFEYVKRFMLPISAIWMAIFGLSFGSFTNRMGKSYGIVLACLIALVYNVLYVVFASFINSYNPIMLAIIPNILLTIVLTPVLIKTFK